MDHSFYKAEEDYLNPPNNHEPLLERELARIERQAMLMSTEEKLEELETLGLDIESFLEDKIIEMKFNEYKEALLDGTI